MQRAGGRAVPRWAVAIARRDDVLVFRLDRVDRDPGSALERVLTHEVVHQVLGHAGGLPPPRWFEEGLCVYRAGLPFLQAAYTVERLAAGGNLPTFAEAERAFAGSDPLAAANAYQVGHEAVIHFHRRFSTAALRRILRQLSEGVPFPSAFRLATGTSLASFEEDWRAHMTPSLPFLLYILVSNLEWSLICIGGLVVAGGYVRWRIRRERAMQELEEA